MNELTGLKKAWALLFRISLARIIGIGGADGIRTHYLLTASQTLSRLSYSPVRFKNITKQLGKLKLRD